MLPILRLAALPIVLLGCIAVWSAGAPQQAAPAVMPPELSLATAPDSAGDNTASLMTAILGRPLFEPSRRQRTITANPPAPANTAVPRLTGTIIGGGHREAMLISASAGRAVMARESDQVEGLHILQIFPGEIVAESAAGRSVLQVSHDSAANSVTVSADAPVKDPRLRSLTDQDE